MSDIFIRRPVMTTLVMVGIFLFGVVAVLGEIACLTTAVIVLPAVLVLIRPTATPKLPVFEWDAATAASTDALPGTPRPEIGP